ncbi:hypothetical protein [Vibrio fortis]|uniref:hypothetical protein n=1 Tax=Vibrio fortis TaxID=212667 RepID=UPI0038CD1223
MLKRALLTTSFVVTFSLHAHAECDLFSLDSIMFDSDEQTTCLNFSDSLESFSQRMLSLSGFGDEPEASSNDYWSDWVLQTKDSPIITQSISSNYVGLGMWFPEDLEDKKYDMTTEEWILNHGLQLSIGFGEKSVGEPRMRFDYRWHDAREADMMMQIEFPF